MANIKSIQRFGNGLMLYYDDGTRDMAYKSTGGLWLLTSEGGSTPGGGGGGGGGENLPAEITFIHALNGAPVTISGHQIDNAYLMLKIARELFPDEDVEAATKIAFITCLVEAPFFDMYANVNVPDSLNYPHDKVGSDNYSLGLFQQQTIWGWGTTAQLMNAEHNVRAFYGGPGKPQDAGTPGLLDISPSWKNRATPGTAAQAVQGSDFPDRYDMWLDQADAIYEALKNVGTGGGGGSFRSPFIIAPSPNGDLPPVGSSDAPLAEYGPRTLTGNFHEGLDFGYNHALNGATIHAAGAGEVIIDGPYLGYGNCFGINHGDYGGKELITLYGHRQAPTGRAIGSTVEQWEDIGFVGSTGNVTGPHLHWETHVTNSGNMIHDNLNGSYESSRTAINPRDFMEMYGE